MTSKEKLENIVKSRDYPDWDKEQIKQFKNDIEKDLEILDILKDWLIKGCNELQSGELIAVRIDERLSKVKEWLKDGTRQ